NSKSLIAGLLSIRMNQSHCADASYLMGPEPSLASFACSSEGATAVRLRRALRRAFAPELQAEVV
ncbi:hypothetical protein, partial [Rhizobium leguminosarum]|uniref:hypothetical protein n=1 Tax=Rhizobium leguminosarum TaxID=384 RepID=UPI00197F9861